MEEAKAEGAEAASGDRAACSWAPKELWVMERGLSALRV